MKAKGCAYVRVVELVVWMVNGYNGGRRRMGGVVGVGEGRWF